MFDLVIKLITIKSSKSFLLFISIKKKLLVPNLITYYFKDD